MTPCTILLRLWGRLQPRPVLAPMAMLRNLPRALEVLQAH